MLKPPDAKVVSGMAAIMSGCTITSTNNCLNGVFGNSPTPGLAQLQYVQGKYEYTTGFSETSFYIFSNGGKQPGFIEPMLIAPGVNRPLAYTDALTLNTSSCTGQCVNDVKTFAQFLNSPATRLYICFSKDAPAGTPPRRLSPAASSFWQQPQVKTDWMYQQYEKAFKGAKGYPNEGMPGARKTLQAALCKELQASIPDACAQ